MHRLVYIAAGTLMLAGVAESGPAATWRLAQPGAVQQSSYKPGLRKGKPDTFTIEVTVSFRLQ
jgi:hypothetical protein